MKMKTFLRKSAAYVFDTTAGGLCLWILTSSLLLAKVVFGAWVWPAVGWVVLVLWGLSGLAVFAAFACSLFTGAFGRAVLQLFLGGVCLVVFLVALFFAECLSVSLAGGWRKSEMSSRIPFSVEYRHSHPFLAEYDRRISFRSGKRIGVRTDTGGAGPFAVYALGDGMFCLADGVGCDSMRSDYRVNVANETVEMNLDGFWVKIPDESVVVTSWGSDSLGVTTASGATMNVKVVQGEAVGPTLQARRFLGCIRPNGRFAAGGVDPFAGEAGRRRMGHETEWRPTGLMGMLPFEIENGKRLDNRYRRIRLSSGRTLVLAPWRRGSCAIFRVGPDEYNVVDAYDQGEPWLRNYRVNVADETMDVEMNDHWIRLPEGALSVRSMGCGTSEDGEMSWHVKVRTAVGEIERRSEAVPVGDYKARRLLVGTVSEDGVFTRGPDGEEEIR